MRSGFTTGSCAAAAAKAASYMLFSHKIIETIAIITPSGTRYEPKVEHIEQNSEYVSCAIQKDSGDDPDITNGIYIYAKVSLIEGNSGDIKIVGGCGIGRITRPGLEMPVGEVAINSVPRRMIIEAASEVVDLFDYEGAIEVEIYAPEGEEIAKKTFNPRMGIEGGISILGTTGIVEPMSVEALVKTIELDLKQKKAEGMDIAIMVPGNYGETFLTQNYDIDKRNIVQFSNYIGIAIDKAVAAGFEKILVVGHTGKLVKVSGGIMNTHSREADCRMELMMAATIEAAKENDQEIDTEFLSRILTQVTTTAVLELLEDKGLLEAVSKKLVEKICMHLQKRAGEAVSVQVMLYENNYGLLASSNGAEELL